MNFLSYLAQLIIRAKLVLSRQVVSVSSAYSNSFLASIEMLCLRLSSMKSKVFSGYFSRHFSSDFVVL